MLTPYIGLPLLLIHTGPEAVKSLRGTIKKLETELAQEKGRAQVQRFRALQQVGGRSCVFSGSLACPLHALSLLTLVVVCSVERPQQRSFLHADGFTPGIPLKLTMCAKERVSSS